MVDKAVSKEELSHMKKAAKQQQLVEKDSRNLYLLEEGCEPMETLQIMILINGLML